MDSSSSEEVVIGVVIVDPLVIVPVLPLPPIVLPVVVSPAPCSRSGVSVDPLVIVTGGV